MPDASAAHARPLSGQPASQDLGVEMRRGARAMVKVGTRQVEREGGSLGRLSLWSSSPTHIRSDPVKSRCGSQTDPMVSILYRTDPMVIYECIATTGGSKSALINLF
jgi:hypothetical protein